MNKDQINQDYERTGTPMRYNDTPPQLGPEPMGPTLLKGLLGGGFVLLVAIIMALIKGLL